MINKPNRLTDSSQWTKEYKGPVSSAVFNEDQHQNLFDLWRMLCEQAHTLTGSGCTEPKQLLQSQIYKVSRQLWRLIFLYPHRRIP